MKSDAWYPGREDRFGPVAEGPLSGVIQGEADIGRCHWRPRVAPPLSSAAPSSLCRVRAEDRDLVAQGVAEITDIEAVAVCVPEARGALVGAACLKASGVKVTDH